ncbi:MAG: hypothetical protein OIN85_04830 [Candidatus Methanoperedens sp.]|nr:hypothetical protein [Candidatus Methanoperedens sp.]
MKTEDMLIELCEMSTSDRYYQTGKMTLPITNYFAPFPPFHGPCMNAAWCDLGNSPLRRKD